MRTYLMLVLFALITSGCGNESIQSNKQFAVADAAPIICVPGAQVACACLNGHQGIQVCNDTGIGFMPCKCPTSTHDAGVVDAQLESGKDAPIEPDAFVDALADSSSDVMGDVQFDSPAQDGDASGLPTCINTGFVSLDGTSSLPPNVAGSSNGYAVMFDRVNDGLVRVEHFDFNGVKAVSGIVFPDSTSSGSRDLTAFNQGYVALYRNASLGSNTEVRLMNPQLQTLQSAELEGSYSMLAASPVGAWMVWLPAVGTIEDHPIFAQHISPYGVDANTYTLAAHAGASIPTAGMTFDSLGLSYAETPDESLISKTQIAVLNPGGNINEFTLHQGVYTIDNGAFVNRIIGKDNVFQIFWTVYASDASHYYLSSMNKTDGTVNATYELPSRGFYDFFGSGFVQARRGQDDHSVQVTFHNPTGTQLGDPETMWTNVQFYSMSYPRAVVADANHFAIHWVEVGDAYSTRVAFFSCQ